MLCMFSSSSRNDSERPNVGEPARASTTTSKMAPPAQPGAYRARLGVLQERVRVHASAPRHVGVEGAAEPAAFVAVRRRLEHQEAGDPGLTDGHAASTGGARATVPCAWVTSPAFGPTLPLSISTAAIRQQQFDRTVPLARGTDP